MASLLPSNSTGISRFSSHIFRSKAGVALTHFPSRYSTAYPCSLIRLVPINSIAFSGRRWFLISANPRAAGTPTLVPGRQEESLSEYRSLHLRTTYGWRETAPQGQETVDRSCILSHPSQSKRGSLTSQCRFPGLWSSLWLSLVWRDGHSQIFIQAGIQMATSLASTELVEDQQRFFLLSG